MRVISSEPSISIWVTDSNAVWSLVILKYSCITPFGYFISFRKVIISVSFPCVCLSPVHSWSETLCCSREEPIYNSVWHFPCRPFQDWLEGMVVGLSHDLCSFFEQECVTPLPFPMHNFPPVLECIAFWNYAAQQSQSLYLLCFLGIMPLQQYACICVFRKFGSPK